MSRTLPPQSRTLPSQAAHHLLAMVVLLAFMLALSGCATKAGAAAGCTANAPVSVGASSSADASSSTDRSSNAGTSVVASTSSSAGTSAGESAAPLTLPANAIRMPLVRQATGYTCGVACMESILYYNGIDYREDHLAEALGSTYEEGTDAKSIAAFLNGVDCDDLEGAEGVYWMGRGTKFHDGIGAEFKTGMTLDELYAALDAGHPVICDIQAWYGISDYDYTDEWESGHYVIAIGHDDAHIYFMDPSTRGVYTYIDADKFVSRWHDYDGLTLETGIKYLQVGIIITNPNPVYDSSIIEPLE